ncbi:MAG: SDR family oxidoreductase [Ktedonobacteraceae bacterium]
MALKDFNGAVAVITGGASGIGLATARALYAQGAHIVLADINNERLQQAIEQVRQHAPSATGKVLGIPTDVTQDSQVQALMQQAQNADGRIDLVVTSAGVGRGGPIDLFSAEDMQAMMNVNFMGTYNCTRAALPAMRSQQSGHFVFLSSVAGKICAPLLTGYVASKWAIRGFSSALRAELYGTGIDVTTVYPAWVETPMIHQEKDAMQFLNVVAMLTPDQVANAILQAVQEGRHDLTLAPNPDIALVIQIMKDDQDKAEEVVGKNYQQNIQKLMQQQAQ